MKTKIFAIALLSAAFTANAFAADNDMAAPADQNQFQAQQAQPQAPAALNLADNQQDQAQPAGNAFRNNAAAKQNAQQQNQAQTQNNDQNH